MTSRLSLFISTAISTRLLTVEAKASIILYKQLVLLLPILGRIRMAMELTSMARLHWLQRLGRVLF